MQIEVLGSSSLGNAYLVSDGETSLLLDCGLPLREMQIKSDFRIANADACLISHGHLDHSRAIHDVLKSAIDVYALPETLTALNVLEHHRTHIAEPLKAFTVNTFVPYVTGLKLGRVIYGVITDIKDEDGRKVFEFETWFASKG